MVINSQQYLDIQWGLNNSQLVRISIYHRSKAGWIYAFILNHHLVRHGRIICSQLFSTFSKPIKIASSSRLDVVYVAFLSSRTSLPNPPDINKALLSIQPPLSHPCDFPSHQKPISSPILMLSLNLLIVKMLQLAAS